MKESTYGPQFEQLVKDAKDDGVSAGELHEATGASRQAVYGWIRKNDARLRAVGESARGGTMYKWVEASKGGNGRHSNGKVMEVDAVEIGSVFTVTRLRFAGGRIIATLTGPNAEVEAELT